MKVTSPILPFLSLLLLVACGERDEVLPLKKEKIQVMTRKELRTSYGHVSFDSFEYDAGKLVRKIYYHEGDYNSEKVFIYGENDIQMLSNNNGVLDPDPYQTSYFDSLQRLKKLFYRNIASWDFSYEGAEKLPSTSTGTIDATYTFDDSGNLINEKFSTTHGSYEYIIEYDNKINPYKSMVYFEWEPFYFSENNPIKYALFHEGILEHETVNKYEYDQEGNPVKVVIDGDTTLFFYSYIDLEEEE